MLCILEPYTTSPQENWARSFPVIVYFYFYGVFEVSWCLVLSSNSDGVFLNNSHITKVEVHYLDHKIS